MSPFRRVLLPLLLFAASPVAAQEGREYRLAAGPLVDPHPYGFHAAASVSFPAPLPQSRLRAEALMSSGRYGADYAATAGLIVDRSTRPLVPYLLAGGGFAIGHGLSPLLTAGLGWDLPAHLGIGGAPEGRRLPLFAELRLNAGPTTNLGLGFGVRL